LDKVQKLIKEITPLNRYNVSPGLDRALDRIKKDYADLAIHKYPTGMKIWDWEVPQKWDLLGARLTSEGETIFCSTDSEVRVWSGSWPTKKTLSFNELESHLYCSNDTPDLIPWKYKYYFHDSEFYGFSVTENEYKKLDRRVEYQIDIDSKFYDDELRVGSLYLHGKTEKIIIISSCICHPGQANDSLSGVAAALMLYDKLRESGPHHYSYLFTFQPEMIGTMCYLSQNNDLLQRIQYGIYSEMLGLPGKLILQKSFSNNTRIDSIALNVLLDWYGDNIEVKDFLDNCIVNDELILNHVGIHIPTIALNRGTYYQYHTSGDRFEILNFDLILEASNVMLEILHRLNSGEYSVNSFERIPPRHSFANRYEENTYLNEVIDFLPKPNFTGPLFLSKHNLYVDWQNDPDMNRVIDKVMISINGVNTFYDICKYSGGNYELVSKYLNRFKDLGLVTFEEAT
jgi:aminopeptidase-like protein